MLWCKYSPGLPYRSLWFELRSSSISSLCHPQMCFFLGPDSNFQQNSIQKHQVITSREEIFHFLFLSMTSHNFFVYSPLWVTYLCCLPRDLLLWKSASTLSSSRVHWLFVLLEQIVCPSLLLRQSSASLQRSSQMSSIKDIASYSAFVAYRAWHNKWTLTPHRGSSASYHRRSQGLRSVSKMQGCSPAISQERHPQNYSLCHLESAEYFTHKQSNSSIGFYTSRDRKSKV